ncbi:rRNA maturation RNase YbeY [Apibacter adventoris]|uniref:Endoribonuclease YbeY n=1 Tax=Apibacter adventoris TaxID=1679466 RepID=A0A2S8ADP5_9FLAO|nr:rRNA maturation RNase YbeY [Apibacter adventoris]PQL93077.1 rRNA maturation RNase YbeY [Apibacter adventoris]
MIHYFSENNFILKNKRKRKKWIHNTIINENTKLGNINYIFCSDEQLLKINIEYLNHDFYTDIITFDYRENDIISGDIFISIDRIKENSNINKSNFEEELNRVLVHGILHIIGYKDKSIEDSKLMREKENYYLNIYKNLQ